jgi:hypothetical protein
MHILAPRNAWKMHKHTNRHMSIYTYRHTDMHISIQTHRHTCPRLYCRSSTSSPLFNFGRPRTYFWFPLFSTCFQSLNQYVCSVLLPLNTIYTQQSKACTQIRLSFELQVYIQQFFKFKKAKTDILTPTAPLVFQIPVMAIWSSRCSS